MYHNNLGISQTPMEFNYAIKNKLTGKYFNGCARDAWEDNFTSHPQEVFTYSEFGAYCKIQAFPMAFAGCEVVRYI